MTATIDLNFRPKAYFGPERLEQYLISKVKGSVVRQKLKTLFEEGRHSEIETLLGEKGISKAAVGDAAHRRRAELGNGDHPSRP